MGSLLFDKSPESILQWMLNALEHRYLRRLGG